MKSLLKKFDGTSGSAVEVGCTAGFIVGVPLIPEGDGAVKLEPVPLGVGGAVLPWVLLAVGGPWPPCCGGLGGRFCGDPSG